MAALAVLLRRPPGWATVSLPLAAGWLTAAILAVRMHGWWWPGRHTVAALPAAVRELRSQLLKLEGENTRLREELARRDAAAGRVAGVAAAGLEPPAAARTVLPRWPTTSQSRSMRRPGGSPASAAPSSCHCRPPTDDRAPAWRGVMIGPRFPELLAAARGGDEQAFAVLWRDLQPAVLRYLQVAAGQAAEDLAADTWMAVIGGLGRFRGEERAFRA